MKIYLIGNPLVNVDSLPLRILPILKKKFPQIGFTETDPNENFIPESNSIIIDSVLGIDKVTYYQSIDSLIVNNFVSPHDYDLGFHLKLLQKTGRIKKIKIIGVPVKIKIKQALEQTVKIFYHTILS